MSSAMKVKELNTPEITTISIPVPYRDEMKKHARRRGMTLRFLTPLAWEVLKVADEAVVRAAGDRVAKRLGAIA